MSVFQVAASPESLLRWSSLRSASTRKTTRPCSPGKFERNSYSKASAPGIPCRPSLPSTGYCGRPRRWQNRSRNLKTHRMPSSIPRNVGLQTTIRRMVHIRDCPPRTKAQTTGVGANAERLSTSGISWDRIFQTTESERNKNFWYNPVSVELQCISFWC